MKLVYCSKQKKLSTSDIHNPHKYYKDLTKRQNYHKDNRLINQKLMQELMYNKLMQMQVLTCCYWPFYLSQILTKSPAISRS